jgi:DNA-binding Lrp family transcriptional regulator
MIHRIEHKDNFTTIANATIRDTDLSEGARILLLYMLTCSDDWKFSVKGLAKVFGITERTVMRRITELKKAGYIRQRRIQNQNGIITGCDWDIFEVPSIHSDTKPQCGSNHSVDKTTVWSKPQCGNLSPIRNNNSKEITKSKKEQHCKKARAKKLGIYQNVLLTDSEQKILCDQYGFEEVVEYIDRLSVYLSQNPNKNYKNHKSTIEKWIIEDKEREVI